MSQGLSRRLLLLGLQVLLTTGALGYRRRLWPGWGPSPRFVTLEDALRMGIRPEVGYWENVRFVQVTRLPWSTAIGHFTGDYQMVPR